MKVKQLIKVLGALNDTGKVACDMYTLHESEYYSQSQGTMAISEMEFSHVLRAFRKICDDDVRIDTQEGKVKDMVSKEAYQVMWDNCKELEKQLAYFKKIAEDNFILSVEDSETIDTWKQKYKKDLQKQEDKILELTTKIENLQERCNAKDDIIERLRDKLYDSSLQGYYYTFAEVPKNEEGREFVKNCKKYLNKESYNIRVRGQHIKKELYGKGRAYHGANMEDSTHMRVYIDAKQ